jgi:hypothetical protein
MKNFLSELVHSGKRNPLPRWTIVDIHFVPYLILSSNLETFKEPRNLFQGTASARLLGIDPGLLKSL